MTEFKLFSITRHRMATDGVGVTSLVALKGCPLDCKYCINKNVTKSSYYKSVTPKQLLDKVIIDYCYFVGTGGGVTFGGAEPLLSLEPIMEFINIVPEGIAVNVETSLNVKFLNSKKCDLFISFLDKISSLIIDVKTLNEDVYMKYTGISIDNLLKNLDIIENRKLQNKCKIRIPIIPAYTTEDDAKAYADILRKRGFNNIEIFEYIIRE